MSRTEFEAGQQFMSSLTTLQGLTDSDAQAVLDEVHLVTNKFGITIGHTAAVLDVLDRIIRGEGNPAALYDELAEHFEDPDDISNIDHDVSLEQLVSAIETRVLKQIPTRRKDRESEQRDHGAKGQGRPSVQALVDACGRGSRLEEVKRTLDAGADINGRDREGWTPLGTAAAFGSLEVVRLLLSRGAEVDKRTMKGLGTEDETPLYHAAHRGDVAIVHQLLESGADVNARTAGGSVPLNGALTNRKSDNHMEVIKLLLANGARVDVRDDGLGNTPLHQAARNNNVRGAALLLQHGADIHARNKQGWTPLDAHRNEERGDEGREMDELLHNAPYRPESAEAQDRSKGRVGPMMLTVVLTLLIVVIVVVAMM